MPAGASASPSLAQLLVAFDAAWLEYLDQFVVWKGQDAANLEAELIRWGAASCVSRGRRWREEGGDAGAGVQCGCGGHGRGRRCRPCGASHVVETSRVAAPPPATRPRTRPPRLSVAAKLEASMRRKLAGRDPDSEALRRNADIQVHPGAGAAAGGARARRPARVVSACLLPPSP